MKAKNHLLLYALFLGFLLVQVFQTNTTPVVNALPPRPTAVPTPTAKNLQGGFIELHITGEIVAAMWTVVQWQDALGDWHDVTGWQGTLDSSNVKTWWVGVEDLGTGPFRWVVLAGGAPLGNSTPFFLPNDPGEKVIVTVSID